MAKQTLPTEQKLAHTNKQTNTHTDYIFIQHQ